MKTYWRILQFARPFGGFVPQYFIFTFLGIVFGLFNFALLIPLLEVLFGTVDTSKAQTILQKPAFSLSLDFAKEYFNYYFGQIIRENGKSGALQFVCILILISNLLANLFRYLSLRLDGAIRAKVVRNLRLAVYERLTQLQLGFFSNERRGDIMTRLTTDVQEIENSVISTLNVVSREPLTIVGLFAMLFAMSVKLTLFTVLVMPISGYIISAISKKLKQRAVEGHESLGTILSIIDETLGGMRVIKAFNAQEYVIDKFSQHNNRYARIITSITNKRSLASPISEFMGVAAVAGILFYGGSLVLNQQSDLTASEFITYIVLFSQVLVPAKAISTAFSNIQRGLVSGDKILAIIDTQPQIRDLPTAKILPAFTESITFQDVSFAYGTEPVLQHINLTIPKGKTIALVGPSGGGKSTLADLLPRFYDPTSGIITIDGMDIKTCTLHSLRDQLGVVTQESILFNDTIFNNIAFNKTEATEAEVIAAAKIANAHDFILQTPNGYQTTIGDRGGKLSGGQRQRISIARAILKNPPILIMDEATSALDTESEKLVQEALINLMKNRTSLVIAHRLSTIQHADEIIVLQKGKIRERGTHEQLLRQNGLYARLNQMQITTSVVS
ncbi:antibiotic ABC transporter ATP-binding protein [Adhaeribacter arboris]|uniref:Antibiotic ABC transporter ATP-binding protein n=1 Tax=Adhaeribacter arboris TaxID=2072846 RepID=A0A2T2YHN4_9BACT|nr:ABC transporter ATP-binding protein [Adhaeribacter arboris]PSR55023.1 antibiotic ABC transporter ATP-binding protein [Adhaeribacter arboris]